MNCTTAHLKCYLTQTTLGANHCELNMDHTDEEEQTTAEESVVGYVATVVMKNEGISDPMLSADNLELAQEDHCVSNEQYFDMSNMLEEEPLAEANTIQHNELMNCTTAHLKCYLTQTTLGANHCELNMDHTDEEEQTAAEESVVGDVATVVINNEGISDPMSSADNLELAQGDHCVYNEQYYDMSNMLEEEPLAEAVSEALHIGAATSCTTVAEHEAVTESCIESESIKFACTICLQEFMKGNAYYEHMIMHLEDDDGDAACDAPQVCEPYAAVTGSCDLVLLQNKAGSQRLKDDPHPSADCTQASVAPLSARLAANDESKVQATEGAGAILTSEQILETGINELYNQSSQSGTKLYTNVNTKNAIKLYNNMFKKPKKAVFGENPFIRTHTADKPYSCEICNYKCKKKCNLLQHQATHTGEKPFSCEICIYKCARKNQLLQHMIKHTGEKLFSCDICKYKCSRKSNLVKHMTTHTGKKPFSCQLCNYKCTQKSNLLEHMKTHTGEKPFSCEICDYKCARKIYLLRHQVTHTDEKPFSCEMCNYKCSLKSALTQHIKRHTGIIPLSCAICDYKCTRKSDLLRHKKITHTDVTPLL